MKTKQKYFCMKLLALITGLLLSLGLVFGSGMFRFGKASADTIPAMILQEVDRWEEDGYKIEKKSGTLNVESDQPKDYDYVLTISDEVTYVERDGILGIGNVSSRPFIFNVKTSTGVQITGNEGCSHGWFEFTTTNAEIAAFSFQKYKNQNAYSPKQILYVDLIDEHNNHLKTGQAVITCTVTGKTVDADDDYPNKGEAVDGVLRILVDRQKKPNIPVTLTSAEKDRNGKENGVWLNGIDVPEATEEWVHIERFSGMDGFFDNIYFLANENGETPSSIDAAAIESKSFNALMKGKGGEVTYFIVHERSDHLEIERKVGTEGAYKQDTNDSGSDVNFEKGDTILLKKGMKLPGHDGNGGWVLMERGFSYLELLRDQMFTFDGTKWSADLLGATVSLDKDTASVDVDGTITLKAAVSAGNLVSEEHKALTWKSDNNDIATVTQEGVVKGVAAGNCTITVTTGTGDHAECSVTVLAADTITKVTLNAATASMNVGDTRQLTATVLGGSQASQEVEWESDNEGIATVSQNGLVTAVSAGKCTITVKSKVNPTIFTTCKVTVRASASQNDPATGDDDPGAEEDPSGTPEEPGDGTKEPGGLSGGAIAAIAVSGGAAVSGAVAASVIIIRKRRFR